MAGRPMGKLHQDDVRAKIQAGQLIVSLTKQALGEVAVDYSPARMKAIELLLRKSLPDLCAIELTGKDGAAIAVQSLTRVIIDAKTPESSNKVPKNTG